MTTQQTKWGPEIPVNGKRPEWLDPREMISGVYPAGIHTWYKGDADSVRAFDWSNLVSFRLPADHPHYAQPGAPSPSPELTARMVAHLLDCGEAHNVRPTQPEAKRRYDEMKAIVAELRAELEPVDVDRVEAKRLAAIWEISEEAAFQILGRGRALAEAGK